MLKKEVLFFSVLLFSIFLVQAYTLKIPLCNSTINTSCLNYTFSDSIDTTYLVAMFFKDGYLYISNNSSPNYNITIINVTNNTYPTYSYAYTVSSGASMTVYQNITTNDSFVESWLLRNYGNYQNLWNSSYTRNEADLRFVNLSYLTNFVTRNEINNITSINLTQLNEHLNKEDTFWSGENFSTAWRIIIIIIGVLELILIFAILMNRGN